MTYRYLLIMCLMITSCTNQNDANKALKAMGFKDIKMTGYNWFACHKDDFYHTGFTAINPQGYKVDGTVCSGFLFKNSYVRFE